MDERDIIHHLLAVESQAASLAADAQAEADRRIAERDRTARSEYDSRFAVRAAQLEEDFNREVEAVTQEYRQDLNAYRIALEKKKADTEKFSKLMESLLFGEH